MGLKDIKLATSYETTESRSELLDEFYIPVLEQANRYYRIAGFLAQRHFRLQPKELNAL